MFGTTTRVAPFVGPGGMRGAMPMAGFGQSVPAAKRSTTTTTTGPAMPAEKAAGGGLKTANTKGKGPSKGYAQRGEHDASSALVKMRQELNLLAAELDTDPDMEWEHLQESAAEASQGVEGQAGRDAVLLGEVAEHLGYMRVARRAECVFHSWRRAKDPKELFVGETFDSCTECVDLDGCTAEELILFAGKQEALGVWDEDKAANMRILACDRRCSGTRPTSPPPAQGSVGNAT